jgi:predicted 2-oxoglutarate/Fe(II)-dependent dioxygenase YbiX
MSSVADELATLLSTVRRPGGFYASGTTEMFAPGLEVDGVGCVALPLLPIQVEQLVAVAQRAPFGRGEETVVDTEVRRTWQIGADRLRISSKRWAGTMEAILARVGDGLGVAEPIVAELYKLLVYDQGSFFVSHRDTEKSPGMFATLVVVLPSTSTGGELVVRHKGREARLDLRCDDPSEAAFAAFYADCVHEVLPITSGCRLTLVYNLLRRKKGPAPEPPSYDREQARVAELLRSWAATPPDEVGPDDDSLDDEDALDDGDDSPDDVVPKKLIYPLEHAYTPAELSFAALKGADAAVAGVLVAAAPQAGCELHLALLSIEESGSAEYGDGGYRGRRSEPDLEAGEVDYRDASLCEWRRPDGSPSTLGKLPFDDHELSPPDAIDDMEPDDEEFSEATGNEGATFERTYSRAALVLWPREGFFAVLKRGGLDVTLPYLEDLVLRWSASGENRQSPLWRQAHDLAGQMLSGWPPPDRYAPQDKKASAAARMLVLLTRLGDTERIAAFLARIASGGSHNTDDNAAVIAALGLFSAEQRAALIECIIVGTVAKSPGACADLLNRAVAQMRDGRESDLVGAAVALVDAMPGDPKRAPKIESWQQRTPLQPRFVVDLLTGLVTPLGRFDEALARRAADHILAWPKTYDKDSILVPAMRELMGVVAIKDLAAIEQLRVACVAHLRARASEPLEAPKDWRRPSAVGCTCARCSALSRFLDDPAQKTWVLKAAQADRSHVEATIRESRCDVVAITERSGSPHGLVCTKDQASYERRAKQRAEDLANLKRLTP